MYKSGGLKKSIKASRKMKKGGANQIQEIEIDVNSLPSKIQLLAEELKNSIREYNIIIQEPKYKNLQIQLLFNIANKISNILSKLGANSGFTYSGKDVREALQSIAKASAAAQTPPVDTSAVAQTPPVDTSAVAQTPPVDTSAATAAAPQQAPAPVPQQPAAAEEAAGEEAALAEAAKEETRLKTELKEAEDKAALAKGTTNEAAANQNVVVAQQSLQDFLESQVPPAANQDGGRKKKVATRKVKRGGAIDMSKLYNVSGLIVDSKDPVAMAAQVSQDNTPMPFSSSGQGITYSAGIPEQFMRDLNPTLGMAGGKKRTAGSAKTQDKQRAGSAKTKTQDKKRKDSAKTKSKKWNYLKHNAV